MSAFSASLLTVGSSHAKLHLPASVTLSRPLSTSFTLFPPPTTSVVLKASRLHVTDGGQAVTEAGSSSAAIVVQNDGALDSTVFEIRARNRIGLLQVITRVFGVLGLRIDRAVVEFEGEFFVKRFFVTDSRGGKIENEEHLERIRKALMDAVEGGDDGAAVPAVAASGRGVAVRKAGFGLGLGERKGKAERMFGLMDGFLKNDPISLQKDILDHVEYTVARSRFNFDDFEAYQVM